MTPDPEIIIKVLTDKFAKDFLQRAKTGSLKNAKKSKHDSKS